MGTLTSGRVEYLNYCTYSKSLSKNTIRAYEQDIEDFCRYVGAEIDLSAITSSRVASYLQALSDHRSLSAATVKRRMVSLKCFFSWLQAKKKIRQTPFDEVDVLIKLPRRLPRLVTRAELKRMAAVAPFQEQPMTQAGKGRVSPTSVCATTYLAIMLMATTGVRVGELVRIRPFDIDATEGRIRIRGKGNRERSVFVSNRALLAQLRSYLAARLDRPDETDTLLLNNRGRPLSEQALRLRLRKLADRAGLDQRVTPHMLRHTAATLLLEEGVDIRFVQRLLGHQSISTTEIYTHVSDVSLRDAMLRADPIGRMRL